MTDEEILGRYEGKAYVGRSEGGRMRKPSLRSAIKAAHEGAKAESPSGKRQTYRVLDIWAVGTNPIHEYIVVLGHDG
jgi:hypothetical protein